MTVDCTHLRQTTMVSTQPKRSLSLPAAAKRQSKKTTKQELPPDSEPQGDDSDRLLLDQLKAAAPGTELAVDEDEPPTVDDAGPAVAAVPAHEAAAEADHAIDAAAEEVHPHIQNAVAADFVMQDAAVGVPAHPAAPSVMTVSDQTLAADEALARALAAQASPTVVTGKRSRRACSSRAKQVLQEALDSDDDEGDADTPKPRRRGTKQRQDDSDFEGGEASSSGSEGDADEPSADDEEFDLSDDEQPRKKKKKAAPKGKASGKAAGAKPRASTGSVAPPGAKTAASGRGSAKGSGRTTGQPSGRGARASGKASGRGKAASVKAAAAADATAAPQQQQRHAWHGSPAPAASAAVGVAGAFGALSGSSCAVGGTAPRSGRGLGLKPLGAAAAHSGRSRQQSAPATPAAAVPEREAAAAAGEEAENTAVAPPVELGGVGVQVTSTVVPAIGLQRPAASAASQHGPRLTRERPIAAGMGSPAGTAAASSASTSSSGSLNASRGPTLGLGRANGRLGVGLSSSSTGGAAGGTAAGGLGLSAGSMFGGPAFRVPGLRRPKRN